MSCRKQKRDREDSSFEEEDKVFAKSKKIIRSPKKLQYIPTRDTQTQNTEMEEMKRMMKEMMEQMKRNLEENKELREEIRKNQEKWEEERQCLVQRIDHLEGRIEAMDKQKRKNNIIIKGNMEKPLEDEKAVEKFLEEKINTKIRVVQTRQIQTGRNGIITWAKLDSWSSKQDVMKKKSALRGTDLFIQNDLTLEEQRVEAEIRKIARSERTKGKQVKIGYQKIEIDGQLYIWNNKEDGVVREEKRQKN